MKLLFETEGESWTITLDEARAPHTAAALLQSMPLALQLHTPKIAGNHIYWHAPFIADGEGGTDVLNAPPGAFIYWPVRQFLEITYAPLQAETATVTVLGQLDGPIHGIERLALRLREQQGQRLFAGGLSQMGNAPRQSEVHSGVPAALRAAREKLWSACPVDVAEAVTSRGIMHPAGPVFVADGETRALHETLWWIRERRGFENAEMRRFAARMMLGRVAGRLKDFCHFTSSAALLGELERAIGMQPEIFEPLLDEAILCTGRLSAWIDLMIPWNAVNEGFRAAQKTTVKGLLGVTA